ncbi:MAG TPA: zinc-dependent alcohol dehydrogenase family protein [Dehalococcoidia bacterium]|nr:zinc-dependent alcohol dehydrogenase family protein [Dehalococcoidia bacterium]
MRLFQPAPAEQRPLRPVDQRPEKPGHDELLLRVAACAVCRTDLQIVEGDLPSRGLPITPGHQAVGVVEKLGAGVTAWEVGERAGMGWLASTCGSCGFCERGRENLCQQATFTGWDRDGGFAGFITVRSDFAIKLPEHFDAISAAPLLCGGVIGYRALRLSGIEPGQRLGLFGFGASARLAMQVAMHWGCRVYVCTRAIADQQRARESGAAWVGGYDDSLPDSLDAAVTFAPAGSVVLSALRALRPGASVAINAIHLDRVPEFPYELLWQERAIRSVANYTRADAGEFLKLAQEIPIETLVEPYDLAEANEALLALKEGRLSGAAVLTYADNH